MCGMSQLQEERSLDNSLKARTLEQMDTRWNFLLFRTLTRVTFLTKRVGYDQGKRFRLVKERENLSQLRFIMLKWIKKEKLLSANVPGLDDFF